MNGRRISSGVAASYFVGTVLVLALAALWVWRSSAPREAAGAARSAERRKALVELRAATEAQLRDYAMIDTNRSVVRLPIQEAMNLAAQWQEPEVVRSNVIARLKRATPPPPPVAPKAPEAPSEFE